MFGLISTWLFKKKNITKFNRIIIEDGLAYQGLMLCKYEVNKLLY